MSEFAATDRVEVLVHTATNNRSTAPGYVERLGFDLGGVEAVVLSHGHWDHRGSAIRHSGDLP